MAPRARSFHVNVAELLKELEVRQAWLLSEISLRRERLRVLPLDSRERPFLLQQISRACAIAAELESLSDLITGREVEGLWNEEFTQNAMGETRWAG